VIVAPLPLDGAKDMFPELNSGQAVDLLPLAVQLRIVFVAFVVFFHGIGILASVDFSACCSTGT